MALPCNARLRECIPQCGLTLRSNVARARGQRRWRQVIVPAFVPQQFVQNSPFQRRDFRRPDFARARQIDAMIERDPAVLDEQYAIGERDGLGHIVSHHDRREFLLEPHALDQPPHRQAGQRIQRAERFVKGKQAGLAHQCARQRHALLLTAGQYRRPVSAPFLESDLAQRVGRPLARIRRGTFPPNPTSTLARTDAQGRSRGSWNIILIAPP